MTNFIYVFIGGGLGSICRYGMARIMVQYRVTFPLATFLANVIACFVLGYLMSQKLNNELSSGAQLLFMTGFCGGFSTFSTFSAETYQLFQDGLVGHGILNVAASLLVCLLSIYLGLRFGGSW